MRGAACLLLVWVVLFSTLPSFGKVLLSPSLFGLSLLLPFLLGGCLSPPPFCLSSPPSSSGWCCSGVSALDLSFRFVFSLSFQVCVLCFRVIFLSCFSLCFAFFIFIFIFSSYSEQGEGGGSTRDPIYPKSRALGGL